MPSPYLSIWTSPRVTVRSLVQNGPTIDIPIIACLGGVAGSLDRSLDTDLADKMEFLPFLGLTFFVGSLGGLITLYLGSFFVSFTGGWLKGRGSLEQIRTALAWSSVPKAFSLFPWAVLIALGGRELFQSPDETLEVMSIDTLLTVASMMVIIVVSNIWSLILACQTLAEVQQFQSGWRAFLNLIAAGLIIVVPLVLLFSAILIASG
ncbi:MAG: Yip1 family protein [Verrucomicrobiota bacterium]